MNSTSPTITEIPFNHEPNYLALQRLLTRYQNLILIVASPNSQETISDYDLTPLQRQIRAELYNPLPYHRTKWLHSVDSARNLLLNLERHAQNIKSPKVKKETLKDLTTKKQTIKRLRNRIEEIGQEVERLGDRLPRIRTQDDDELLGERADTVLARMGRRLSSTYHSEGMSGDLREGKPVTDVSEAHEDNQGVAHGHDVLFDSSVRKRQGLAKEAADSASAFDKGTTSGFSNLGQTERSLQHHTREHEDLTSALVSMAAQLKQQSRAFQFALTQDESLLSRAVDGLDLNITSMDAASKNMAFLRRMSEEQGWLGRLKLYGIILALWLLAVLLVFVGPKLRF